MPEEKNAGAAGATAMLLAAIPTAVRWSCRYGPWAADVRGLRAERRIAVSARTALAWSVGPLVGMRPRWRPWLLWRGARQRVQFALYDAGICINGPALWAQASGCEAHAVRPGFAARSYT